MGAIDWEATNPTAPWLWFLTGTGGAGAGAGPKRFAAVAHSARPAVVAPVAIPQSVAARPLPPPPSPVFARGPKSANASVFEFATRARRNADAGVGVVFYRWCPEVAPGDALYWEFRKVSGSSSGLGGFGVGTCATSTASAPGQSSENPGCLIYHTGGAATLWIDGESQSLGAVSEPATVGVRVAVTDADQCLVSFWLDGVLVADAVEFAFTGALLIPVMAMADPGAVFTVETRA